MRVARALVLAVTSILPVSRVDAAHFDASAVAPLVVEAGEPEICRGDGDFTQRSVDLLLLLDNSTSLNSDQNPTDPKNLRFQAIGQMLEAVGSAVDASSSSLQVRLGVITFNKKATELISFNENKFVTSDSASTLAEKIENDLPAKTQGPGTNYLKALDKAFEVFDKQSPRDRCRVLVWLTDGGFSHGGGAKSTDDAAKTLEDRTCNAQNGFAIRARQLETRVWSFVVLLSPPTTDKWLADSHDMMRRLTGAPYQFEGEQETALCPGSTERIGSIYGTDQAGKLGPLFVDVGISVAGGKLIDACPITSSSDDSASAEYESISLPAPRFLTWISIVSRDGMPLPTSSQMSIAVGDSREKVSDHFSVQERSDSWLELESKGNSPLDSGWKLRVEGSNLKGFCLRAKVVENVSVSLTRRGAQVPEIQWSDGADNFTVEDLENVEFLLDGGVLDRSELASLPTSSAPRLKARLDVDPSGKLVPEGLSIGVVGFSAQPDFNVQTCGTLSIPGAGSGRGDTPSAREFSSSLCKVDLRGVGSEVGIDIESAQESLKRIDGCEAVELTPLVNGEAKSTFSGESKFDIGLLLTFTSSSLKCSAELPGSIEFTFKAPDAGGSLLETTKKADIRIDVDVKPPPPNWAVWFITLGLLLVAIVLSFGLLWLFNVFLIRLPDPKKYLAVRLPLTISSRDPLNPQFKVGDLEVGGVNLSLSEFEPVRGDRTRWTAGNGLVLERRITNPFLRPLHEPRGLFVGQKGMVVAYGPPFSKSGLKLPFRRALVLVLEPPKSSASEVTGNVFALLFNDPRDGGRDGVEKLISSEMPALMRSLLRSDLLEPVAEKGKQETSPAKPSDSRGQQPPSPEKKGPPRPRFQGR